MCGIIGFAGTREREQAFDLEWLRHRGPDSEGAWRSDDGLVSLGHTRLSILDTSSAGFQPMAYANGRYIIVFNGEIYNFLELRRELTALGYRFATETDTEVILAAYDCWGADCLERFNGMWAFAIFDRRERTLILARDRYGEKPLYYRIENETIYFSSEVQAIHRWMGSRASLDDDVVASIANGRFEYHGTDRTYSKGVFILPAGHTILWKAGLLTKRKWYQLIPGSVQVPKSFSMQAAYLRDLIIDSCRIRMRSDVPIATCLSGGVDSSLITSVINTRAEVHGERASSEHYSSFCAAFPDTILDETKAALRLSEHIGFKLHLHTISPPSPDLLMSAIRSCDGPMHSLAFFPIWSLYGQIRSQGIKVTLDGQGPDEIFGGYTETFRSAFLTALSGAKFSMGWEVFKAYSNHGENEYKSSYRSVRNDLVGLMKQPFNRLLAMTGMRKSSHELDSQFSFAQTIPNNLTPLHADLYAQLCQRQLPTILQQFDRCSMAHGIEARMPFLDYRIVEFGFSLPPRSLVRRGYSKAVLREAGKGMLPDEIRLNRNKIGFNAPIVEWFLGPLREFLLDTMSSRSFQERPFYNGRDLLTRFEEWQRRPTWNSAWQFWPPVHVHLWLNELTSTLKRD